MDRFQKSLIVTILMLIFTTWFLYNTKSDFPLIFQKDLHGHDESSNSVVAANITRKFFPPMVRVNPLVEQQGNWMEGPYWQHIPPLFAYVPYIFFKIDGQITIEVKRLSYAFVTLLTGLLFIFGIYKYRKSILAAVAATVATLFWINTPFTHELITGYAFGASDIVLAFTVVAGFVAILWYLAREREERLNYSYQKLAAMGLIVALPIMAKNLLGAIPATTFFILLSRDLFCPRSNLGQNSKKLIVSMLSFLGLLGICYLSLYWSSPQTFKSEILVSFFHAQNYEGWGRPWHWYITNYLPQRYLFGWTWVYYFGLILGIILNFKLKILNRQDRILLMLSGGWFVWNLVAISLVTSKVPNFIYQSYLLSLFFIVYSLALFFQQYLLKDTVILSRITVSKIIPTLFLALVLFTGYESIRFANQFNIQRAQSYKYLTERERFYGIAEQMQKDGVNEKDLVIVRVSDNDCWLRYNILFLTGAESKTLLEIYLSPVPFADIKEKYSTMYFYEPNGDTVMMGKFSLNELSAGDIKSLIDAFVNRHQNEFEQDIERIKADKSSCQWLVPDAILNAD